VFLAIDWQLRVVGWSVGAGASPLEAFAPSGMLRWVARGAEAVGCLGWVVPPMGRSDELNPCICASADVDGPR